MQCPICDNPRTRSYLRLSDRFFRACPGEYTLHRCDSCATVFQDLDEVGDRIPSFYPEGYWWRKGGRLSRLERIYRSWMVRNDQLRFLLSLSKGHKNTRCLDIGCGEGTFVRTALQVGLDAYGLEQSAHAAELADLPGRIFVGSEKDLIDRGEKFQILTLFHSLEHMARPFAYIRGLQKLLTRPGGVVVQVPNSDSLQARLFKGRWYGLDCPRHINNFSLFSLLYLLGKAGYRVQRVRHFSLRDNAAAMVSSLFPGLDPMSQRVRLLRRSGASHSAGLALKEAVYFGLLVLAQPVAALESAFGRGGTVTVYATVE